MNKCCTIFLSLILIGCLSGCKKDAKPQIPASLLGKWYIRQYTITASSNTFTDTPYTVHYSDTATNVYYQFNSDGTGFEQTSADPNFVTTSPVSFTYHVSGTNIIFSHNTPILMATICSFEMPTGNTLALHCQYSYNSPAGAVNNLQDVYLSK